MWYVYILQSQRKRWYYTGSTNRIDQRLEEHNRGKVTSSKPYLPLKLVFSKKFDSENLARAYERRLKDRRIEKEGIIRQIESVE